MIRNVRITDAEEITKIYNYYIAETVVTFETEEITNDEMENRIVKKIKSNPWIVYEEKGKILGYAYVSEFNFREAYSKTREVTIYLHKDCKGRGIGSILMKELIDESKKYGFHLLVSLITVPNEESVKLHEKFGFSKMGTLEESGYKMDKWLDVDYWQLKI
ncbi:phosphinothricin acetyltransferase [Clostridium sp. DSM 8431]|uniref:GNAT family N-acetyltransferase n=1 Tax=Clostridium sp. DSM 8431 TaxID=1761781 RepID=UPI0008F1B0E4|nr:GNAT family N-acetyltransferase [Clostridium sp. DSM 8431]SFU76869.1 phosphinothricin acetyltransferase [Clostridium sp. DSM 8431]